ncbi:Butyryl-CoA dehydrogenase OS=Castellaniella defragrans (strain DSM / CCUG 39792 / 65Phen) OX=1437824 GN=BN940_11296 PE=4 SV=1 [Castellaniella denitrificans]|uniref:acyl-CoA dehydrogenase family protein n=1 Tax=Castellaniella sp. TaxID=1955812 RepID=UPI002AFDE61B|nr:acyl-CoA dehydrogenase family protein [Castellaniella sp.]
MSTDLLPAVHGDGIDALVRDALAPQADAIDQGRYPGDFMRALGRLGGFGAALPAGSGGLGLDLAAQIEIIAQVGRVCGSTAFLAWCQSACAWYFQQTDNAAARERYLAPIARGEVLAGTGMSNCVKHLAGIERINLRARRDGEGYRVSGALPWVSNLGPDHLVIAAAAVEEGGYIMFAVPPGSPALTLRPCPAFAGMEGTGTYGVHLKNAWIPPRDVLAEPAAFEDYIGRIKPGFLLMQIGMGLGLVRASLETIRATNQRLSHVNTYLDDQEDTLERDLQALLAETARLARLDRDALLLDILRARARASELGLRATQSAALHAGAAGYLMSHPAQRRLREALFVAIVTPALKHLRKEIHALEQQAA